MKEFIKQTIPHAIRVGHNDPIVGWLANEGINVDSWGRRMDLDKGNWTGQKMDLEVCVYGKD